jgi:hypothetical protein
MQLKLNEAKD